MNAVNDQESERALLGAILLEPEKVLSLCQKRGLSSADFYDTGNGKLFSNMLAMHAAGKPIDVLTVQKETQIDLVILNATLDSCPTYTHAEYYIDQIQEAAARCRLNDRLKYWTDCNKPILDILAEISEAAQEEQFRMSAGKQDLFPCLRLDDLQNYSTPPDYSLAGDGWLRRGAGCLLTGGTGLGKSVLAEQIAISISAGIKILGCIPVHSAYHVLYIGAENDEETLKRDFLSIIKHADGKPCPILVQANLHIHHVYGLSGSDFAAWLAQQVEKVKPDLIVVDPYQAYLSGQTDINNTASFLSFIQPVNRIIRDHNSALLLIMHTPKPRDRESWTARESVYLAAGTSAISNWTRTSAELTAADEDSGRYRLRFGKNAERNGLTTDLGGIVRDLYIEHSGSIKEPFWRVSDDQAEPAKSEYARQIIRLAAENPALSYKQIAEELGCSKTLVSKWYPKGEMK